MIVLALITSGCSLLGSKQVEIVSKPIEIEIMQPDLPRPVELTAPKWYVVSEARIANLCKKIVQEDGTEKRPKTCDLEDRENPDWPEGYSYLDRFLEENKERNNGDIVFMAISIGDYEIMSGNMQELRRYIREVQEVIVYYRNVTINDKPAVGAQVKVKD